MGTTRSKAMLYALLPHLFYLMGSVCFVIGTVLIIVRELQ